MKDPEEFLPKKGNYKALLVYQKAECIYDMTFYFAHTYMIARKDRTVDQMIQSARSGKQNIAEGCAAASTSSETELKLMGVARASMKELLTDYEDYLRVRGLEQWPLNDSRTRQTQNYCKQHHAASDYTRDIDKRSDEAIANIAITLLHQYDSMMGELLKRLQKDFIKEGGIRERMTAARLGYRNQQKEAISQLKADNEYLSRENDRLMARIKELEALLAKKGGAQ